MRSVLCLAVFASALAASRGAVAAEQRQRAPLRPKPVKPIEGWAPSKTRWHMVLVAGAQAAIAAYELHQAWKGSPTRSGKAKLALSAFAGWQAADLASGEVHRLIDAYGDQDTPLVGYNIQEFNHHHVRPRDAATMPLFPAVWGAAKYTLPAAVLATFAKSKPTTKVFLTTFLAGMALAQHSHNRSHVPKGDRSPALQAMQGSRIFLKYDHVRNHHPRPQAEYFEPLNGLTSPLLKATRFNRLHERFFWYTGRLVSRTWTDRSLAPPSYLDDGMHWKSGWARMRLDLSSWWHRRSKPATL
jgi:hypothetical protein